MSRELNDVAILTTEIQELRYKHKRLMHSITIFSYFSSCHTEANQIIIGRSFTEEKNRESTKTESMS